MLHKTTFLIMTVRSVADMCLEAATPTACEVEPHLVTLSTPTKLDDVGEMQGMLVINIITTIIL